MLMVMCRNCHKNLTGYQKKYCSNQCQKDNEYHLYIQAWRKGDLSGSRGVRTKNFSGYVIRYLRETYGAACSQCGWNGINPVTGKSPLELDHIDGDPENNKEENLRLLCPNCHSLTPTYKNLNFGNGRVWRREKYVKIAKLPL